MKLLKTSLSALILCIVFITSCKKEEKDAQIVVRMKDDPAAYQQVNIEVLSVEVHSGGGWVSLPTNQGIYDLLELQNGVTTLLVNGGTLPAGEMNQMRLVLGNNNSIMIDSTLIPLSTPSAQQSGLKINVNHNFEGGETYELLLDFVAGQSIVEQGNGDYSLKPVIKVASVQQL